MKFRNQTLLCLAIYEFEAHVMLKVFKVPDYYRYGKNLTPMWLRSVDL